MGRTEIDQIDRSTGEVLSEGALVWVPRRTAHPYGKQWIAMRQDGLLAIAKDKELGLEAKNVFLLLNGLLDFENYVQVPQIEIANALEMHRSHVNRAIKLLVVKNILLEGPKVGHHRTFRLNPSIGWKGSKKNLRHQLTVINGGQNQLCKGTPDLFGGE